MLLKKIFSTGLEMNFKNFPKVPFSFHQMTVENWTEWSTHLLDTNMMKKTILQGIDVPNPSSHADLDNPTPPFHQFILSTLAETERLLDDKYAELYSERSELSMNVP